MSHLVVRVLGLLWLAELAFACSGTIGVAEDRDGGGTQATPDAASTGLAVRPGFCTAWSGTSERFDIACLAAAGAWEPFERENLPAPTDECRVFSPQLAGVAGDGMALLYIEECGFDQALKVQRAAASGWQPVGGPLNADGAGGLASVFSQFGGSLVEFQDDLYAVWTMWPDNDGVPPVRVMRWDGAEWTTSLLAEGQMSDHRHVTFYASAGALYVHYGEPAPAVWEVTGGTAVSKGSVELGEDEASLYTSLTEWKGQLVLAYASATPASAAWDETTWVTKVAFHDGATGWTTESTGVEDTPGHDGAVPFLFTIGGDLHIMVADYTTEDPSAGVGTRFRFRVKRWTGAAWEAVGDESRPIGNSQRLEYLLDGDTVLVSALAAASDGSERIVLVWRDGVFGQAGDRLAYGPNWDPRPGALVAPAPANAAARTGRRGRAP